MTETPQQRADAWARLKLVSLTQGEEMATLLGSEDAVIEAASGFGVVELDYAWAKVAASVLRTAARVSRKPTDELLTKALAEYEFGVDQAKADGTWDPDVG